MCCGNTMHGTRGTGASNQSVRHQSFSLKCGRRGMVRLHGKGAPRDRRYHDAPCALPTFTWRGAQPVTASTGSGTATILAGSSKPGKYFTFS